MKSLTLAFLLLPPAQAAVSPNPCSETSTGPCTPDATTQASIMLIIADGLTSEAEMESAKDKAAKAKIANDYIGQYKALQDELSARQKMQNSFNVAILMTQTAYNVAPPATEGPVSEPHGPRNYGKAWAKGVPVEWSPVFSDEDEIYMKVSKDSSADHKDHYIAGRDLKKYSGNTFPNGQVVFSLALFKFVASRIPPSPGFLAETIHHEAHHFAELIGRGWDNYEAGESRAYAASVAAADIFEVGMVLLNGKEVDFKVWLEANRAENYRLSKNRNPDKLTPLFPDPDREPLYRGKFDAYKTEAEKLVKQIEDLKPLAEAQQEQRQREEQERQAAEEQRRRDDAKAQLLDEVNRQIRDCGFEPDYRENGHIFSGFRREIRGWPSTYAIVHNITLDEFKVGLMFARACLGVTMEGVHPDETSPCNEAFTITNQHWNEPGFKEDAQLEVNPPEQMRCMDYLHDHWTAPMSMDRFASMLSQAKKEYQKTVDARWRQQERERRERESSERSGREAQEGRDGSDRGSQDGRHPHAPLHCRFNSNGAYCD